MKNKKKWLFLLLIILIQSFLVKYNVGKDIGCFENNKSKNPIPVAPVARYYHIWEDRLYFLIRDGIFQYDISNKAEITYLNEVNLSDYYLERTDHWDPIPQIIFHDDMLIVVSQNTRIDEKINIKIDIWELTTNDIVKSKTIEYIRDYDAEILCNYQEKLIICDFWFNNLYLIDLELEDPIEEYIGINNETFYYHPSAILDENKLYLWDRNYFDVDETHELISGNLLIYDIENLNSPLLKSNWTTTEPDLMKCGRQKVGDIIYLKSEYIAIALNITDSTNITEIGTFQVSSERQYIKIFDYYAIVVQPFNITIYDISEIENSIELGNYTAPFELIVWDEIFGVFDGLIFASNVYSYETMILDWSNPEVLFELSIILPDLSATSNNIGLECCWIILIILPTLTIVYKLIRKRHRSKNKTFTCKDNN